MMSKGIPIGSVAIIITFRAMVMSLDKWMLQRWLDCRIKCMIRWLNDLATCLRGLIFILKKFNRRKVREIWQRFLSKVRLRIILLLLTFLLFKLRRILLNNHHKK